MKTRWLDRRIACPGPYLCLCLSEAEYVQALAHLKLIPADDVWCQEAGGKTHYASSESGDDVCIVCIRPGPENTPIEIAGVLVHEAVHVWQKHCDSIGERSPGSELEAYAIQTVSQELMAEFARRLQSDQLPVTRRT